MKSFSSVVYRLSVKFAAILTAAVLLVIVAFFMLLQGSARQQETRNFRRSLESTSKAIASENSVRIEKRLSDMPFFMSCIVYDTDTKDILYQRNDRLGILPPSAGKTKHYSTKKFLKTAQDISIQYMTSDITTVSGRKVTVQIATNSNGEAGKRFMTQMLLMIALAAIPILILSLLLCLYITKKTMEPVVQITNTAKSISSTNLDQLLPETGKKDELDNLAQTFNDLFGQLKKDFDRERSFTSNVSHELKTPVAVVLGQANLLRRWGKDDPAQLDKSINTILSESRSMEVIISNLLQLSRLDSGKIKPENAEFSLKDLFERTKNEFGAISPDAEISCQIPEQDLFESDPELLHQMLTIIIQNSIKFADKKPEISIKAELLQQNNKPQILKLQIEDNGPGFDEEILPHVFERFFRGDSAHVRSAGGSGLGLSIAKAIAESLNGTINAANSKKHGALITVTLGGQPVKQV